MPNTTVSVLHKLQKLEQALKPERAISAADAIPVFINLLLHHLERNTQMPVAF